MTLNIAKPVRLEPDPGGGIIPAHTFTWRVGGADADWDDESGQVEVRIDLRDLASPGAGLTTILGVSYHVMIMAAEAQH